MPGKHVSKLVLSQSIIVLSLFFFFNVGLNAASNTQKNSLDEIKKLLPDSSIVENKVTYVDFWASWCIPCRKSFPWMEEMLDKYRDSGLVIITINLDKDHEAAEKFFKSQNLQSINLFDTNGDIAKSFGLEAMPTSLVFDKTGKFVLKHEGFLNQEAEEFENEILILLRGGDLKHE